MLGRRPRAEGSSPADRRFRFIHGVDATTELISPYRNSQHRGVHASGVVLARLLEPFMQGRLAD